MDNSTKSATTAIFMEGEDSQLGKRSSPKSATKLTKINGKRIFVKQGSSGTKNLLSPSLASLGYTNGIAGSMFPIKPSHQPEQ
jgi:hypothetical protein